MARDAVKISRNLDDNAVDNVFYVQPSDGTDVLAINADGSVNTTINNASIVVTATDLDIRDLSATQDNVAISDGTDSLEVNADGSINVTVNNASIAVTATDLDIRDLSAAQDNVAISDGSDTLAVNADGSINAVVTATDLDIRDLSASQDNVAISDGTDTLGINTDGSINVVVTGGTSGTAVADASGDNSLATTASANHDYTATGGAFKPAKVKVSSESIATFEILTGPTGTLVSRAKLRTSVENPNATFEFPAGFQIANTEVVRVIQTNDSNKTKVLNSTITGEQL